jgi:hypothetical protein
MVNNLLINLVNSVLGTGNKLLGAIKHTIVPIAIILNLNLRLTSQKGNGGNNPWHCWVCNKRGNHILSIFKFVKAQDEKIEELKKL